MPLENRRQKARLGGAQRRIDSLRIGGATDFTDEIARLQPAAGEEAQHGLDVARLVVAGKMDGKLAEESLMVVEFHIGGVAALDHQPRWLRDRIVPWL